VVLPPAEIPPDPEPPAPPNPGCSPTYDGTNAPFAEVRQALAAAGAKEYWRGVVLPVNYVGPLVPITVPVNVMNAIAWQESGWQSAIVNCVDGGTGTMQIMPATVSHLNQRFGMDYTFPLSLQENTEVGANYLQWLMMYFGTKYFGQAFDMYAKGPIDRGVQLELRDVVIAAYNVGPGGVENLGDPTDPADDTIAIYNWPYVNAVEAFMDSCPCDSA
jgi:soluble lytic murein transglycosylase-like protein